MRLRTFCQDHFPWLAEMAITAMQKTLLSRYINYILRLSKYVLCSTDLFDEFIFGLLILSQATRYNFFFLI